MIATCVNGWKRKGNKKIYIPRVLIYSSICARASGHSEFDDEFNETLLRWQTKKKFGGLSFVSEKV